MYVVRQPKITENADYWWFQEKKTKTKQLQVACRKELKRIDTNNGYFKRSKLYIHYLSHFFHWPPTPISLPAPLILRERHLFIQSDRFDSSIFPPEAAAIWNSCSLPLHLIHLSSLCKSQLKTFFSSCASISISLVLFSSIKQSLT